jgi:hypothetical protein
MKKLSVGRQSFSDWENALHYAAQLRNAGKITSAEFNAIKQQLRGGKGKRGGTGKAVKEIGLMTGGAVRPRLDRASRRKHRDDGGAVPGTSREEIDPRTDAIRPVGVSDSDLRRVIAPIADAIARGPDYFMHQISGPTPAGERYVPDDVVREYYGRQGQRRPGGRVTTPQGGGRIKRGSKRS